jgi:hypothetical protein
MSNRTELAGYIFGTYDFLDEAIFPCNVPTYVEVRINFSVENDTIVFEYAEAYCDGWVKATSDQQAWAELELMSREDEAWAANQVRN